MGGTARGFIYTDKRQYDITGTYVPLFGLNNAFAKLLGPAAGRDGEGLFGVTFAIRGDLPSRSSRSTRCPPSFRRIPAYVRVSGQGNSADRRRQLTCINVAGTLPRQAGPSLAEDMPCTRKY